MPIINIAKGVKNSWSAKKEKDIRLKSFFEGFSNRTGPLPSIPNAKDHKIPQDVLHYVKTEFQQGTYFVRIPLVEELKEDGKGGMQVALGSGERREALYTDCYWNTSRKVANVDARGVENNSTKYLQINKEAASAIHDWFSGDRDYSIQTALIEAGDRYLTDSQYWAENQELKTAPVKKIIHPNIAFTSMTPGALTRSLNYDTYNYANDMTALVNALSMLTPDHVFNLDALDAAIDYAASRIAPLSWEAEGGQKIEYVILISPRQARQLKRDQEWKDVMASAEVRGPKNRAISGIIGTRTGALVVEDSRSPVLSLDNKAFRYMTVKEANTMDNFYGLGALQRTVKGPSGSATGTMEIARILGRGAIGIPKVSDVQYEQEDTDFKMREELCGELNIGHNRMDFKGLEGRMKNISSALYFTSTPTITF